MTGAGGRLRINDHRLPDSPGVYIVYCDTPIGSLPWDPSSGPVYVGKAEEGLRRRVARTHGGDTGRSTLRRSYGALLKEELALRAFPRPRNGVPEPIDFTNYTFSRPGDDDLTAWMIEHLRVHAIPTGNPGNDEARLIADHSPPLNLTGWDNPWTTDIKAQRKRGADEAEAFAKSWNYSITTGKRAARTSSPVVDYSDHGRWVEHSVIGGWRGRVAYRLVEGGDVAVLWEDTSPRGAIRPSMFTTFDPTELILLDHPPEPWLDTGETGD